MNRQEIELIVSAMMFLLGIAVIVYDRIKYHKYYEQKGTFVILRLNNVYVRKLIRGAGLNICPCTHDNALPYLYATTEGDRICAFNEQHSHFIADASKRKQKIIDCGINTKKFILEVQKIMESYKTED